ncbi:GGDEF domain-containing protein [Zoogloea dura]|uniref:diguanylate cyclase n=1 Tax=Zoogloea dura TaxID=2728840 RepID=A0A848GF05_9RHOO|nr:GGDEF domain-containing protein [Zoogloea dura]NML28983.1 GGDEF domain-containing protein [Zoogloea dura]
MNRLLLRQLKRATQLEGEAAVERLLAELKLRARTESFPSDMNRFLLGVGELLERVSASYDHHERDVELHSLSLALSSEELEAAQRELLRLSRSDRMTQLWNRGYWQERLQEEFQRARRFGQPVSLLIFDIDHFKRINDQYGHPVGDQVICLVADVLRTCSRQVDICARYGGEEFAAILPGTNEDGAFHFGESLRLKTEALGFSAGEQAVPFTISIGVAELDDSFPDAGNWLVRADHALYDAKRSGRNRTCRSSQSPR